MNDVTLDDIFSDSAIWIPRVNGLKQIPVKGSEVRKIYAGECFIETQREIILDKKDLPHKTFSYSLTANGHGYGVNSPKLSYKKVA